MELDSTPKLSFAGRERLSFIQNMQPTIERSLRKALDPLAIVRIVEKYMASGMSARVCQRSGSNQKAI